MREPPAADVAPPSAGVSPLAGADLAGADLAGADLTGADLTFANLDGATLAGARLVGAALSLASLRGADLRGADLTATVPPRFRLGGAVYDFDTVWPDGFDPERAGAVRVSRRARPERPPG